MLARGETKGNEEDKVEDVVVSCWRWGLAWTNERDDFSLVVLVRVMPPGNAGIEIQSRATLNELFSA